MYIVFGYLLPVMGIKTLSPRPLVLSIGARASDFKTATKSKDGFLRYLQTRDSDASGSWSWMNEGDIFLSFEHKLIAVSNQR
jgi:hypothetical protein